MNSLKGSGGGHMKFLTFGTPLNKMKHPSEPPLKMAAIFYVNNKPEYQSLARFHLLKNVYKLLKWSKYCVRNSGF